jgi:hypothetical protein
VRIERIKRRVKPTGGAAPVKDLIEVDGRTHAGRRYRDVCRAVAIDLGNDLTETQKHLCAAIASTVVLKEQIDHRIVSEQPIDLEQYCSITNTLRRLSSKKAVYQ